MIEASLLSVAVVVGTVGVGVEADQKCSVQSFANLLAASVQLVLSPYGIFDRNIATNPFREERYTTMNMMK